MVGFEPKAELLLFGKVRHSKRDSQEMRDRFRMNNNTLADFLASCADVLMLDEAEVTAVSVGIDGDTPLHVALWQGKTALISLLVEAGADVNAIGDMSETPLHVAVHQQNIPAVKILLNSGANPILLSQFGKSARGLAYEFGGEMKKVLVGD